MHGNILDQGSAIGLIILLSFATREGTSSCTALAVKFISQNPKVLAELKGKEMVWGSKTFMAFGGGVRLCLGAEFARLQMAIFLHHLVAYYDFSLVQDCEITRTPFFQFTKDLLINISHSPTN